MTIAVTERQGRIAPVFEWCRKVLVVEQAEQQDLLVAAQDWSAAPPDGRANLLKELRVSLLVCGGIGRRTEEEIRDLDIGIVSWVAGDVWEVLSALRLGLLDEPRFAMPGGRMCMQTRRRGRPERRKGWCKLQ